MSSSKRRYKSRSSTADEDADYQLALRLSEELNGGSPPTSAPPPSASASLAAQPGLDADAKFALALQNQYDSELATRQAGMSDSRDSTSNEQNFVHAEQRPDASIAELGKGLTEFMTSLKASKCAKCRRHLVRSMSDCTDMFEAWATGSVPLSSRIKCKYCSTSSCVTCHSNQSTKLSTLYFKEKQLSWCCSGGRLFLTWLILCGFDQRFCATRSKGIDKSKSKIGHRISESVKSGSSKPARGAGVGFGGRENYASAFLPAAMAYSGEAGGLVPPSFYDTPPEYPPTKSKGFGFGRRGESVRHEFSTEKAQDAQRAEDKFNTMILDILERILPSLERDGGFDIDPPEALTDFLLGSKSLGYCAELLRNDSLDDATKRKGLYHALLSFLQKLGTHVLAYRTLFSKRVVQPDTVTLLMLSFNGEQGPKESAAPLADSLQNLTEQSTLFLQSAKSHEKDFLNEEGQNLLLLCRQISELSQYLLAYTKHDRDGTSENHAKDLVIKSVPDEDVLGTHAHAPLARALRVSPPGRIRRLITEITTLQTGLPPGIFVRYGENRPDIIKVIIIGPSGTPYENGIFEFDFWCDGSFPNKPPQVKFKGTGGGKISINPNLYADGKVCLSLLGTWAGEPWKPSQSTLLQVIISLQAMIFCDEPWYNEPGRESRYKTGAADGQAIAYNNTIRELTVRYAMLAWLDRPPPLWLGVVNHHFQENANNVFEAACRWAKYNSPKIPNMPDQMFLASVYGAYGAGMERTDITSFLPRLQTALHTYGLNSKNKAVHFNSEPPPVTSNFPPPRYAPSSYAPGYGPWGANGYDDFYGPPGSPNKGPGGNHSYPGDQKPFGGGYKY